MLTLMDAVCGSLKSRLSSKHTRRQVAARGLNKTKNDCESLDECMPESVRD